MCQIMDTWYYLYTWFPVFNPNSLLFWTFIWQRSVFLARVYIYMCSQRVDISAIVTTYLLCGVSIPFIFRRFPFATSFMRSWFLFLFGTPLMCSRMLFFLTTVLLILFLCSINRSCSSLNTQQSSGWILPG